MSRLLLLPFSGDTSLSVQRYWVKSRVQTRRDLRNFYCDAEDLERDLDCDLAFIAFCFSFPERRDLFGFGGGPGGGPG